MAGQAMGPFVSTPTQVAAHESRRRQVRPDKFCIGDACCEMVLTYICACFDGWFSRGRHCPIPTRDRPCHWNDQHVTCHPISASCATPTPRESRISASASG